MKYFRAICLAVLLLAGAAAAHAQQLFPSMLTPGFRSGAGTEYSKWDNFSYPVAPFPNPDYDPGDPSQGPEFLSGFNYGDVAAGASNPYITQTLTDTAFITSGLNIYSFSAPTGFNVVDNVATTLGAAKNVVFQFDTLGTFVDYSTIRLNYTGTSGSGVLTPLNMISESRVIVGGMGGFTNRAAMQWDLSSLGVTSFTITFQALGSSNSFNIATLDVSSNPFSEIVASARTWDGGAGDGKWNSANNWSGDTMTSVGGNIAFGAAASTTIDLDTTTREVGQLNITRTGTFTLSASGGATLRINTGIAASGGGNTVDTISAPIFLGGHNFIDVSANTTLTLSGNISGAPSSIGVYPAVGIYKEGAGNLILSGTNTFLGSVTVDGGSLTISGTNQYTGATTVTQGTFILQGDAPNGGTGGTLGKSTSNVLLSYDPGTTGPFTTAAVLIDGNFTVGRTFSLASNGNTKILGGRNATTGATYSGSIALASDSDNVVLRAEGAGDIVNFTGTITGGAAGLKLTKDGNGTVVFGGGVAKTYSSATTVAAGTLKIANGTSLTGDGNVTVSSAAQLIVHGTLSGAGSLAINGGTVGGSGTISRAIALDTGDVISPGDNSPGVLKTIGESWAGGATLKLQINDTDAGAGSGWGKVEVTGGLSLTATTSSKFKLELDSLTVLNQSGLVADFDPKTNHTWLFLTTTGLISGFNSAAFQIDTSHFLNTLSGNFSVTMGGDSKSLSVQYLAVPEPSSTLLAMCGGFLFLHRRRRASRRR